MTTENYNNLIARIHAQKDAKKEYLVMLNNGVCDADIEKIQDANHKWFCSQRVFYEHNLPLEDYVESSATKDDSATVDKFVELICDYTQTKKKNPYKWIETLENTAAMQYLTELDKESKYIITAVTQQQRTYECIAVELGTTRQRISRKYKKIIEPLRDMYADEYAKCERRHQKREAYRLCKKRKKTT